MNIIGHGIDIVEINGLKKLLEQKESLFETRCFTDGELNAAGCGVNRVQYLAGRFAAKEAVLKALGTGWSKGTSWLDIEVRRLPSGQPSVVLHGRCKEISAELGIVKWLLSISHTASYATASAIAVGSTPETPAV